MDALDTQPMGVEESNLRANVQSSATHTQEVAQVCATSPPPSGVGPGKRFPSEPKEEELGEATGEASSKVGWIETGNQSKR